MMDQRCHTFSFGHYHQVPGASCGILYILVLSLVIFMQSLYIPFIIFIYLLYINNAGVQTNLFGNQPLGPVTFQCYQPNEKFTSSHKNFVNLKNNTPVCMNTISLT